MVILAAAVFTARRYASAIYAVVVCSSVCLSVTRRYYTKTAKGRIMKHKLQPAVWPHPSFIYHRTPVRRASLP